MAKPSVVVCSVRPELIVPLRMAFAQQDVEVVDAASMDEAVIVVAEQGDARCVLIDQCDFDDEARLIAANVLAENSDVAVLFLGVRGAAVSSMAEALEAGGAGFFRLPVDVGKVVAKLASYLGCERPDLVGSELPGYQLVHDDLPEPPPLNDEDRPVRVTHDLSLEAQEAVLLAEEERAQQEALQAVLRDDDVEHTLEYTRQELTEAPTDLLQPPAEAGGFDDSDDDTPDDDAPAAEPEGSAASRSVKNRVARLRRSREKKSGRTQDTSKVPLDVAKTQVFAPDEQKKLLDESREGAALTGLASMLEPFEGAAGDTGAQPLVDSFAEDDSDADADAATPVETTTSEGDAPTDPTRVVTAEADLTAATAEALDDALADMGGPSLVDSEEDGSDHNDGEGHDARDEASPEDAAAATQKLQDDAERRFAEETQSFSDGLAQRTSATDEDQAAGLKQAQLAGPTDDVGGGDDDSAAATDARMQQALQEQREALSAQAEEELVALRQAQQLELERLRQEQERAQQVRRADTQRILDEERERLAAEHQQALQAAVQAEREQTASTLQQLRDQAAAEEAASADALRQALEDARAEAEAAFAAERDKLLAEQRQRRDQLQAEMSSSTDGQDTLRHRLQEELSAQEERLAQERADTLARMRQDLHEELATLQKELQASAASSEKAQAEELRRLRLEQEKRQLEVSRKLQADTAADLRQSTLDEMEALRQEHEERQAERQAEHETRLAAERKEAEERFAALLQEARDEASQAARADTEAKLQTEMAELARRESEDRRRHDEAMQRLREDQMRRLEQAREEVERRTREEAEHLMRNEVGRLRQEEEEARQRREEELVQNRRSAERMQQEQLDALRRDAQTRIQSETQALLDDEFRARKERMEQETLAELERFEQEQKQARLREEEAFLEELERTRQKAVADIERSYEELHQQMEDERERRRQQLMQERAEEETVRRDVQAKVLKEAALKAQAEAEDKARQDIEAALSKRDARREQLREALAFKQGVFSGAPRESGLATLLAEIGGDAWQETHAILVGAAAFAPGTDMPLDPDAPLGEPIAMAPASGSFDDGEVVALLFAAHALRITGAIDVVNEDGRMRSLYFEEGEPVGFDSNLSNDRPCEHLLRAGLITSSRYAEMRAGPRQSARRACSTLVDDGGLLASELFTAVRGVLTEQLLSVMEWDRGTFLYREDRTHDADRVRLAHSFDVLLAEGVRRKYDADRLWRVLGAPSTILGPGNAALRIPPLSVQQKRAARLLDGKRALDDVILETGGSPEVALTTALVLLSCGACEVVAKGIAPDIADRLVAESDIERERIEDRLQLARHGDYFTVLGVDRLATTFEIRAAAERLRNRFDPERFSSPALADLKRSVQEIRDIIDEAEDVLADDQLRDAYRRNTISQVV